jgi:hypothetical protein
MDPTNAKTARLTRRYPFFAVIIPCRAKFNVDQVTGLWVAFFLYRLQYHLSYFLI